MLSSAPSRRRVGDDLCMTDSCQPYEEITSQEFGELAAREFSYRFEPAGEPDDVVFTGPCPRCRGAMTYVWPLIVVRRTVAAAPPDELEVPVICRCTREHRGADGEPGCGAYWNLRVPRPQ